MTVPPVSPIDAQLRRLDRESRTLTDLARALAPASPGMARQNPDPTLMAVAESLRAIAADGKATDDPAHLISSLTAAGWLLAGWRDQRFGTGAALLKPDRTRERLDAALDTLAAIHEAILVDCVPAALRTPPADVAFGPAHRPDGTVTVVVPVTAAARFAIAGIASISRARNETAPNILAVSDGTAPDETVARLRREAEAGRCTLIESADLKGVTAAIDRGLAEAAGDCVILASADVTVADGWIDGLAAAASAADIAGVAPLSNAGTGTAWPFAGHDNPLAVRDLAALAAAAKRANGAAAVVLPVADNSCLYLTRDALAAVGGFDAETFPEATSALADWSLRASAAGRRVLAAPGVFVFILGQAGFAARHRQRLRRGHEQLSRRHRGHAGLKAEGKSADPLASARRALDGILLGEARGGVSRPVVHLIHAWGGGAAVHAADLARRQAALGAAVAIVEISGPSTVRLIEPAGYPNLVFDLAEAEDAAAFRQIVAADGAGLLHVHSVIGMDVTHLKTLAACFAGYYLTLHDFYLLCPQITLSDRNDRPCDVAPDATCEQCVAAKKPFGPFIAPVAAHRDAYRAIAAGAKAIYTPSAAARTLLERGLGDIPITVAPHDEKRTPILAPRPVPAGKTRTIVTIGSFSKDKGTPVLEGVIRAAITRHLPLKFAIAGPATWHNPPPNVTVLGPYDGATVDDLLKRVGGQIAFLPSVVAETYMFSLSECVRAGCYPVVFDLGAQAERLRALGWGTILPLGTEPEAIADLLTKVDIPPLAPERVAEWLAEGRLGALDYYAESRASLTTAKA